MIVTSSPKAGYDSWVDSANTHTEHGSGSIIQLQSDVKRGFLWMPLSPRIKGATITSAILTGHAYGVTASQTVTVERVAAKWEAGKVTWANQPGVTGTAATASVGVLVQGQEFSVDITALVQSVASGASNFGWRIKTSVTGSVQKLASFNSGSASWTLTVEFGEVPDPPTGLAPDGTIAAAGKPVVSWDATDYGGDSTDITAAKVQVDTNLDGTVDWDSGWVAQTVNQMDLAAAGMTGTITSGQSVNWRVYVQDDDGGQSAASDWATYTYRPQPTLTLDSPAAGVIFDPTTVVLAHISTALLGSYRIQITDGDDQTSIRYDSGKRQATDPSAIAYTLPLRNDDGSRIFTDDADFQIHVRAWDTYDRQSTPGLPAHVDVWTTVHFDDNLALSPVASFQASQVDATPFVKLTWTDVAAHDAYLISRDGVHIARLTAADVTAGSSSYTWVDVTAIPYVHHVYEVRAITVGVGRSPAKRDGITIHPMGLWLLRSNGESVRLSYTSSDAGLTLRTAERRATYTPVNLPYAVDVLTAYEGLSGHAGLSVCDMEDQDIDDAIAVLSKIKAHPTERVRLIYNNVSKPVVIRNLSVVPSPVLFEQSARLHTVDFDVTQVGEFDWTVASGTRGAVTGVGVG